MKEEHQRNIAADQMAQGFIIEILLSRYYKLHPPELWDDIKDQLIASGTRTEHFTGVMKSEEDSEVFADVVLKMHDALRQYAERGLLRARGSTSQEG